MFVKKRTKSNLLHIKKIEFFSKIFYQVKIIFYFRSVAVNQSESINQNSKTSNSKNFQQHTFAKSNRVKFTFFTFNKWFEKSIILLYKTSIFFRLFVSKISSVLSYKMLVVSSRLLRAFFDIFVCSHVCRICNDIFESNNDLHHHLKIIHFDHASRHEFKKHQALERNIMIWKFLICWSRNRSFFYFFSCIINKFLEKRLACFRHATQRERCNFFSLMTFVTINLHIQLNWWYFDQKKLTFSQSLDSLFHICILFSR